MLALKRREGDWTRLTNRRTGEVIDVRVFRIQPGYPGRLSLAFDDPENNYQIDRLDEAVKSPEAVAAHSS